MENRQIPFFVEQKCDITELGKMWKAIWKTEASYLKYFHHKEGKKA